LLALAVNANDIAGERVLDRLIALNNIVLDITPEFWHLLHQRLQVSLTKVWASLGKLCVARKPGKMPLPPSASEMSKAGRASLICYMTSEYTTTPAPFSVNIYIAGLKTS